MSVYKWNSFISRVNWEKGTELFDTYTIKETKKVSAIGRTVQILQGLQATSVEL